MKPTRLLAAAMLALACASGAGAQMRLAAIRPDLGMVYIPNSNPDTTTLPYLINYSLGCGFVLPFKPGSAWSFEPSLDLSTTYYELESGRAVPTETAERSAFVIGALLDAPVVFSFSLWQGKIRLGVGAGPAFDLRAGFLAAEEGAEDLGAINAYFWHKGRFFKPSTFFRGEYGLTERVDFGFSARAYWPVFNWWAGEGLSFFDQGIYGGAITVRYKL